MKLFVYGFWSGFLEGTNPIDISFFINLFQKVFDTDIELGNFEESDIWRIFIQLVKGLKSLHDLKILHRDLKSANVFLFNDGSAKLGDLNVSKVARRGLGYTQTGTPYYAR